ncbi:MAG: hypothetical protein HKN05_00630, partial [Rhizobiales bacterium]|nr:hypothetical protein [Hyphomicrobiales bacterium]
RRGFDLGLLASVNSATSRPVILSGGYGEPKHLVALQGTAPLPSAIAVASVLHYNQASPSELIELAANLTSTAMAA